MMFWESKKGNVIFILLVMLLGYAMFGSTGAVIGLAVCLIRGDK